MIKGLYLHIGLIICFGLNTVSSIKTKGNLEFMSSIEDIEEESRQFSKCWRSQIVRGMVAISIGAFLFLVFSPNSTIEFAASFLFIAPLFIWVYKSPKNKKKRVITSITVYIASAVIFFGWVQNN